MFSDSRRIHPWSCAHGLQNTRLFQILDEIDQHQITTPCCTKTHRNRHKLRPERDGGVIWDFPNRNYQIRGTSQDGHPTIFKAYRRPRGCTVDMSNRSFVSPRYFYSLKVGIPILSLAFAVRIDIDTLRASLFVCLSVSIGVPPLLEDCFVLESFTICGISAIILAPGPSQQGTWVYKWSPTIVLSCVVCVKWQRKRAILIDRYQHCICLYDVSV